MAKKKDNRKRPTVAEARELRAEVARLAAVCSDQKTKMEAIERLANEEANRGLKHAERGEESLGLLHLMLDELGAGYASVLTNRIRRFLGRGGETPLLSRTQKLIADARQAA